ncbi:MAG: hypothetical protein IT385_01050 [Deltaproteobacteria bacterium]|nr:hypothetical protein [Deltaproteobacteria bacterium]
MMTWRSSLMSLIGLALVAAGGPGCPDDSGGPGTNCKPGDFVNCPQPRLDFQPAASKIEISDAGLQTGQTRTYRLRIINTGFATLSLKSVVVDYTAPVGANESTDAFTLAPLPVELPSSIEPFGGTTFPQGLDIEVVFTKPADSLGRDATITFFSNDPFDPEVTLDITTNVGTPSVSATPNPVQFGLVPKSTTPVYKTLSILNQGSVVLNVGGFRIAQDARFGVRGEGFEASGPEGLEGITLEQAIVVPPGEARQIEVSFLSDSPAPAEGQLVIYSDDPQNGSQGYVVNLVANKDGPCILVSPRKINFGGKVIGTLSSIGFEITSCGTAALSVRDIKLASGSSPDFELDFSTLPEGMEGGPNGTTPLVIPVGQKVEVGVIFIPDAVNPRDADNVPIPDEAVIEIGSNAFESKVEVEVTGAGSDVECPTPIIRVEEGEEVIPQTVIHLDARQSYAPFGEIATYNWSIISWPEDTPRPTMVPNFTDPQPVVELNVVGLYTFGLKVRDEFNNASGSEACPDATYTVIVQPDQAIHIELTWVTPGDADETDEGDGKGTDLDLHFAHEYAIGPDIDGDGVGDPWFSKDWDVFWFKRTQNWGSFDPNAKDDPSLDRDDVDGGGPENLNLGVPEDDITYRIGVHFWDDHAFGAVTATVKVYHYADLIYEVTQPDFAEWEMWCVGEIHWPLPAVERCAAEGDPERIAPNYINPFFRPPTFR